MAQRRPVIGFDLDMTLAASDEGIVRTFLRTGADLGVTFDEQDVRRTIGIPLTDVLRERMDADLVPVAVARYRELYPTVGIPPITALPGALEALECVRRAGGRTLVVSAKTQHLLQAVLDHLGITPDAVIGDLFAEGKGGALRTYGATAYVGTIPVTWRRPGRRPSWPSAYPPGRTPALSCARPARTSC